MAKDNCCRGYIHGHSAVIADYQGYIQKGITVRLLASDATDAISLTILQGCRATEYRNRALNWPELKQPIRQKHPSTDESTDLGSDSTETYYGQGMSKKAGHVRMKKVKKIKRKYCKVEKPDSTEQNREIRLIEQGEKSSKVCKSKLSREHKRSKCICDRQFTNFRISDTYAHIEQLRNELKGRTL